MPFPRGLTVAALAVTLGVPVAVSAVAAGPTNGLCSMDTSRGAVPQRFPVDACVDSGFVWLHNNLDIPIGLKLAGNAGVPARVTYGLNEGLVGYLTRQTYPDAKIMLPGDIVKVPVGGGEATVAVEETEAEELYAQTTAFVAGTALASYKASDLAVSAWESFAAMMRDAHRAYIAYADCLKKNEWFLENLCRFELDLAFRISAARHVGPEVLALRFPRFEIIKKLLDVGTFDAFRKARERDARLIESGQVIIKLGPVAPTGGFDPNASGPPGATAVASASTRPRQAPPAVHLLETTRITDCYYLVKFTLTNFNPGSRIKVSDVFSYIDCDGNQGTAEWDTVANGAVNPDGSLIWGYYEIRFGTHTLRFVDNAGHTATITVTCARSSSACVL